MKRIALIFLVLSLISLNAYSETKIQQNNKIFFNTESATSQFDEINKKLSDPGINLNSLISYVKNLEDLQDQAEVCVNKSEIELKKLNEILQSSQLEQSILIQQSEYKYLQKKKLFYSKHLSECRFYVYRSKEALVGYKDTIQKLSTYKMLKRSAPIWTISEKGLYASLGKINFQSMYRSSGIENISLLQIIFGLILIGFGVATATYLRSLGHHWMDNHPGTSQGIFSLVAVFSSFIIPIAFLGITSVLFSVFFIKIPGNQILEVLSYSALGFILLLAVSKYLFCSPYSAKSPLGLSLNLGKSLHKRAIIILAWVFLGILSATAFDNQPLSPSLIELARTLYITVFVGLLAWFFLVFYKMPVMQVLHHTAFLVIKIIVSSLLLVTILTEWIGFHQLAIFIITAISLTLGLLLLAVGAWRLINNLYKWFDDNKYHAARGFKNLVGVKPHRKLKEVQLIKYICYLAVLFATIVVMMKIWGASQNIIDSVVESITSGFTFAEIKIIPLNIITALISFSFILLAGRFLATIAARKERFEGEKDTQVAVASIVVYVAFAIALLFSLLIVGVNFTGLAIIAGALSVGIGLGLQNIVNNFVSGIILLLEKPIKPGDRVIVGSTEGFVKKIRLRSTQITTLAKEDVIVPNADLIANQVTNYMFRDHNWRVVCQVGVAYGSAIHLVKEVLLEVALKHPDVVQDAPNQPSVLFRNFGDSSLIFDLWCIINDVNKKFIVASELNFAIDDAFKAHKITIAFPQRDVHIKDHAPIQQS